MKRIIHALAVLWPLPPHTGPSPCESADLPIRKIVKGQPSESAHLQISESAQKSESAINNKTIFHLERRYCNVLAYMTLFMCLIAAIQAPAQTGAAANMDEIHPLQIGDTIPDITIRNLHNFETNEAKLSDFKGKLLVLDFWSTWCSSCIAAFPKMEELQNDFGDDIQIVLVNTSETDEQVAMRLEAFKERGNEVKLPDLPIANGKSVLRELFPYRTVPHHVWIDENLVVKAITSGYNTTSRNIIDFLNDKSINLVVKQEVTDFDSSQPLWLEGGGRHIEHLLYHSYIAKRISGIERPTTVLADSVTGKVTQIRMTNRSLLDLYKVAYGRKPELWDANPFRFSNRISLEVADTVPWRRPSDHALLDEWLAQYSFCYEASVSEDGVMDLFETMQQDLRRYFGYEGRVERRTVSCWLLTRYHGARDEQQVVKNTEKSKTYSIRNQTIDQVMAYFSFRYKNAEEPFITDIIGDEPLSFVVDARGNDPYALRSNLQRQGYDLRMENREIDMLIITDVNN